MSRSLAKVFAASAFVVFGLSGAANAGKVVIGANVSGPIQGVLVSAYTDTSVDSLLYTAPAKTVAQITLTQACIRANGNVIVQGSTIGPLMQRNDAAPQSDDCETFSPGLVIPPNERLSCNSVSGGPSTCTISLIKSAPAP